MKPPTLIAWENGPTGGVSSGDVIAILLMANSFGYWVRWSGWWSQNLGAARLPNLNRTSHQGFHKSIDSFTLYNGEPTIPQVHYYHDDINASARFCYSLVLTV